ncbi:small ubiquitin-related modifier 1-like isoform X2 [Actinidia eriantha]|uniref:small ubiquitin-related modifier 1-like isoform X2 n=1 Tax=Actinidia eriantha TaxID=165200 RepID=UPI00258F1492|nr:small ubiquitin-related modifier 1-like isoform X2 [Actinidia eriantha]
MSKKTSQKRALEEPAPTINLKDGVEVFFRIKRNTMLQKVLTAYCNKRNIGYKYMEFLYNGERFAMKRTPDDASKSNHSWRWDGQIPRLWSRGPPRGDEKTIVPLVS